MTGQPLENQVNEAVRFTLARVTIPAYIELDDLRQEVAVVIVSNYGLEQDRLNRLAEERISTWVKQETDAHAITVASAEAVAEHLGCYISPEELKNLSHRGVEALLSSLPKQQKRVICMRFGVGMPRTYTVPEVATILHITPNSVSEYEQCAMDQLRKVATTRDNLTSYLLSFI